MLQCARFCGHWAAKGLVGENPPEVCITGSTGVRWAEGEKGPHRSLGKALVGGEELWGRGVVLCQGAAGWFRSPGLLLQAPGQQDGQLQETILCSVGKALPSCSWDAFEDYLYSLLSYGC